MIVFEAFFEWKSSAHLLRPAELNCLTARIFSVDSGQVGLLRTLRFSRASSNDSGCQHFASILLASI